VFTPPDDDVFTDTPTLALLEDEALAVAVP
jgi:hypothetical protein